MNSIIARTATDYLDTHRTAQAMQEAGANVFSITTDGSVNFVWAKFDAEKITPDQIDQEIDKKLSLTL